MERIKQIWTQLEANGFSIAGLLRIRYSGIAKSDVFLGVKFPEQHRMLIIKAPFKVGKEFIFKYEFRGLRFDKTYDPDDSDFVLLNLVLVEEQFKDIFDTLVADVLESVINESDINVILKNYSNRLIKWQSLFERFTQPGLTGEEQRGLFGELYMLDKMLERLPDKNTCLLAWTGATGQSQDFQGVGWAVEVKTCLSGNHHKIQINGERQLDTRGLDFLALHQVIIEKSNSEGITLNAMVDNVTERLKDDFSLLTRFRSLLAESGYFDHQRDLYEEPQYVVRQENSFEVKEEFPRIQPDEIRNGVDGLRYTISASDCIQWKISEEALLNKIQGI